MQPPPPAAPPLSIASPTTAAEAPAQQQASPPKLPSYLSYSDSVDSSPRSRNADSWDETSPPPSYAAAMAGGSHPKIRLMCSYGGHIFPRPNDKALCYVGGETRMIVLDRHSALSDVCFRLSKNFLSNSKSFILKYQLPNEDLDSLISLTTDEDLENMIEEYHRLNTASAASANPQKCPRLRLFMFPESISPLGSILENSTKSEDWFLSALNNGSPSTKGLSESSSVNCLLGLEEENLAISNSNLSEKDVESQATELKGVSNASSHSVSDLPTIETTSSFGSTSSSPSMANLPPIRVHGDDKKVLGIEEQFIQMNAVASGPVKTNGNNIIQQQKQEEGGVVLLSSPPTVLTTAAAASMVSDVPVGSGVVVADYPNRVFSDDERLDHGVPVVIVKPPQQAQLQLQPIQFQQKPTALDLPSPNSVSSDGSASNPLSRQKPMIFQDTIVQIPSGNTMVAANAVDPKASDLNTMVQMQQQVHDSGYVLSTQLDLQHQQLLQQQQQKQHQQQYVHAGAQFVPGTVPTFYSVYPSHRHHPHHHPHHPTLGHQYPVYYVHAGQAQGYSLPVQQSNYNESGALAPSSTPQTPLVSNVVPHSAAYNPSGSSPTSIAEMATGVYITAPAASPPLVQVPSSQNQQSYVGFSQVPHPAQSIAPTASAPHNYTYEYADPTHGQVYYAQPVAQQLATQYQTMTPTVSMVLPEAATLLSTDNVKQLKVRASQPQ